LAEIDVWARAGVFCGVRDEWFLGIVDVVEHFLNEPFEWCADLGIVSNGDFYGVCVVDAVEVYVEGWQVVWVEELSRYR